MVISWLMLSVTALWTHTRQTCGEQTGSERQVLTEAEGNVSYRAAAANWFLRLGEAGSVDRALAASSSLLEDMAIVFRLDTTCVWSSLDWKICGRTLEPF